MSAFIAGFVSTPFSFHPSRAASRRLSSSAIHFAEHNVDGPDDGHHVGHQVAPHHCVKRLQIDKRRRANAHAIRLNSCVTDDIVAELALGTIDRKSTRLNSSHLVISYAVFCLKKKKNLNRP